MKTIDEIVEFEYDMELQGLSDRADANDAFRQGIEVGVKAGIEFAESWVSVEDELPYVSKNTLVAYKPKIKGDYKAYTMRVRNQEDFTFLKEIASEWKYITRSNEEK